MGLWKRKGFVGEGLSVGGTALPVVGRCFPPCLSVPICRRRANLLASGPLPLCSPWILNALSHRHHFFSVPLE